MAARLVLTALVVAMVTAVITGSISQGQVRDVEVKLADALAEAEEYEADLNEAEARARTAENALSKLKREAEAQEAEAALALDAQGDLQTELEAAYAAIQQLQADLATATRRGPRSIRCVDGLSVSEIVSGDIDPCQEWQADY